MIDRSIKQQMMLEGAISKCQGMPYLLLKVAEKLNDDVPLWRINVCKEQSEHLKGTQAHSRANRKDWIVKVLKEKSDKSIGLSIIDEAI